MQTIKKFRTGILIVLLLLTCYAANLAEDNYSYDMAARSNAFAYANGNPQSLSGGQLDESYALLSASDITSLAGKKTNLSDSSSLASRSVISSVFGAPLGQPSGNTEANDGTRGNNAAERALFGLSNSNQGIGQRSTGGMKGFSGTSGIGALGASSGISSDSIGNQ